MRWLAPGVLRGQQRIQLQVVGVAHCLTEVGMHPRVDGPEPFTHAHLALLFVSDARERFARWPGPYHFPDGRQENEMLARRQLRFLSLGPMAPSSSLAA